MQNKLLNIFTVLLLSATFIYADANIEDDLAGFNDGDISAEINEEFDPLDGFSDDGFSGDVIASKEKKKQGKQNIVKLSGDIAFKSAYGVKSHKIDSLQYRGFNKAQTSLYLQLDSKLNDNFKLRISGDAFYDSIYDLHPNTHYSDDILDAYKTQLRFDDVYIQGSLLNNLDMKLGRQIVIWGKSDSLRVTDVINPLDNREPGLTDIEDLRLPTAMLKLDYYLGDWEISAMAIAESRVMIEAPARSEFFNVDAIFPSAPNPFLDLDEPSTSLGNMQYAFAANGIFSGWDLSFYAADVFDQKWHIEGNKRVVSKVKMLGSALNIAYGSWLLKTEAAYLEGIKYNTTSDAKNRMDMLVGFDYMGFRDTTITIEIANRHIYDYEPQMQYLSDFVEKDEMQSAFRYTKSYLNDTLDFSTLLSIFGSSFENGGFGRIW
ncbi:MAG: DUF1302 domain-containing protein, partial [Thiovulaceae bacterium]|nr:DUF1302 domain-containing protein [Sulfurimonadaceae bacterium]